MPKFARIEDGKVREVGTFDNIKDRFHPSLIWAECPSNVEEGFVYDGVTFSPKPDPTSAELKAITNAQAKAKLTELDAQNIRAIREFIVARFATDPLLPPDLVSAEGVAKTERAKIK